MRWLLLHDWPYVGLGLALVLCAPLVLEARRTPGRWRTSAFALGLLWPMYLLHQFEEHGVDLLGKPFAFLGDICATLGHAGVAGCPADAAFIFAVNVIACPIAFAMPLLWRNRHPRRAVFAWGIPLVNAFAHVGAAVVGRAYNAGLASALVLFVPLCAWTLAACVREGVLRARELPLVFLSGAVVHGVLIASLLAREHGLLGEAGLLAINAVNGFVPYAFAFAIERWSPAVAPVIG